MDYSLTFSEALRSLFIPVYASRNWEEANKTGSLGRRIIAIIQYCPIVGPAAAFVQGIFYLIGKLFSNKPAGLKKDPAVVAPAVVAPSGPPSDENSPLKVKKNNMYISTGCHCNMMDFRKGIYLDTVDAMKAGYIMNDKVIKLDSVGEKTEYFGNPAPCKPRDVPFKTTFEVVTDDTLNVAMKLNEEGENTCAINMAHPTHRGGGVEMGCPAQEEAIARRSTLMRTFKDLNGHLGNGAAYTSAVKVFRTDEKAHWGFMEKPKSVAIASMAAFDFREGSLDREYLGIDSKGIYESVKALFGFAGPSFEEQLLSNKKFRDETKDKIRNLLRVMAHKGHTVPVLGAFGCGAFGTPPKIIAQLTQEVFNEAEFHGQFKKVVFAILVQYDKDKPNVEAFKGMCDSLNRS